MTIETKISAKGRISYFGNGSQTRLGTIVDGLIDGETYEIINLNGDRKTFTGYTSKIKKEIAAFIKAPKAEIDAAEYAVNSEAQMVATYAEIRLATAALEAEAASATTDEAKAAIKNNLPVYRASCLTYTYKFIDAYFTNAIDAHKWLIAQAKKNPNFADGGLVITREISGNVDAELYCYSDKLYEINAEDEPEFATYIYEVEGAKDAEINIAETDITDEDRAEIKKDGYKFIVATCEIDLADLKTYYVNDFPVKTFKGAIENLRRRIRCDSHHADKPWAIKDIDGRILVSGKNFRDLCEYLDDNEIDNFGEVFNLLPNVAKPETPKVDAVDAEINMDGATEIGTETVKFFNGKFYSVFSRKYLAGILQDAIGIIHYCIFSDGDTEIYNVREHEVSCEEFFSTLKQRGAFTGNAQFTFDLQRFAAGHKIGCDNPDCLIDKLTAEYAEAEKISRQRQAEFDAAKKAVADAMNRADGKYFALTDLANKHADKLRKKFLRTAKVVSDMMIKNQDGFETIPYFFTARVEFDATKDGNNTISIVCDESEGGQFTLGKYRTFKQAENAIDLFAEAVKRGDKKFTFATDDSESNQIPA